MLLQTVTWACEALDSGSLVFSAFVAWIAVPWHAPTAKSTQANKAKVKFVVLKTRVYRFCGLQVLNESASYLKI